MKKSRKKSAHPYISALGFEIRKMRLSKKLSLEVLGTEIGIDGSNMQKIELGQNLTLSTLLKICICLEINPSKLFEKLSWDLTEKDIETLTTPRVIKRKPLKKSAKKTLQTKLGQKK